MVHIECPKVPKGMLKVLHVKTIRFSQTFDKSDDILGWFMSHTILMIELRLLIPSGVTVKMAQVKIINVKFTITPSPDIGEEQQYRWEPCFGSPEGDSDEAKSGEQETHCHNVK